MKEPLSVLDLFSGIGGFSAGLEATGGFRTAAFCEIDPYCREVLVKHWPDVPCHEDITKLGAEDVGSVDVICGGFPCQPWSNAGRQAGANDDRDLWPEMRRVIAAVAPRWVVAENVPGIVQPELGLARVLGDLGTLGYRTVVFNIPAAAVGAHHIRNRIWIVAHRASVRCDRNQEIIGSQRTGDEGRRVQQSAGSGGPVAHADRQRCGETGRAESRGEAGGRGSYGNVVDVAGIGRGQGQSEPVVRGRRGTAAGASGTDGTSPMGGEVQMAFPDWRNVEWIECHDGKWRAIKPGIRLLANGVPARVDQIRGLGNAIVPQIAQRIGLAILEAEA